MSRKPPQNQTEDETLPPFEASIEEIESILAAIEEGDVPLEQSLERYARGMKLIRHCRAALEKAEKRIQQLTVDESGEINDDAN